MNTEQTKRYFVAFLIYVLVAASIVLLSYARASTRINFEITSAVIFTFIYEGLQFAGLILISVSFLAPTLYFSPQLAFVGIVASLTTLGSNLFSNFSPFFLLPQTLNFNFEVLPSVNSVFILEYVFVAICITMLLVILEKFLAGSFTALSQNLRGFEAEIVIWITLVVILIERNQSWISWSNFLSGSGQGNSFIPPISLIIFLYMFIVAIVGMVKLLSK